MDWGCQFFTPKNIAKNLAVFIKQPDLVIDLYAGSGRLHIPILESDERAKLNVLAIDIDPNISNYTDDSRVKYITADCLDPEAVSKYIAAYLKPKTLIVLNPPFRHLNSHTEQHYWQKISNIELSSNKFTHRVECLALASALSSAPMGARIVAIIPETLIKTERLSFYFQTLTSLYNMEVLTTFKRERFGLAEVDVAIISLEKISNECLVSYLNKRTPELVTNIGNYPFNLFRGKVCSADIRDSQVSVRHLKLGGIPLSLDNNAIDSSLGKTVQKGDILIARVGARMLGRVGIVITGQASINESVLCLRVENQVYRKKLYQLLVSEKYLNWLKEEARGTANRFVPTNVFKQWLRENIDG